MRKRNDPDWLPFAIRAREKYITYKIIAFMVDAPKANVQYHVNKGRILHNMKIDRINLKKWGRERVT